MPALGKAVILLSILVVAHAAVSMSQFKARVKDVYGPEAPYWTPLDVWVEAVLALALAVAGGLLETGGIRSAVTSGRKELLSYDDALARSDLVPVTPLQRALGSMTDKPSEEAPGRLPAGAALLQAVDSDEEGEEEEEGEESDASDAGAAAVAAADELD